MGYYSAGGVGKMLLRGAGAAARHAGSIKAAVGVAQEYLGAAPEEEAGAAPRGYAPARRGRRTNPMNIRAARRAIRRLHSFEKLAKTIFVFTRPHAGGHFKMKHKKRRVC